ncbi:Methylamine utilisation protein MauE [Micromonospora siamensis]|uniref:Methylamine utilisation protein MauE n=2 Tax=Micromonospora siamensis TaxID=299152 RepID=A0A1C5JWU0_9ACTN|nr:Methylamine utilisation protein MauE [Micromonospora siamensis]
MCRSLLATVFVVAALSKIAGRPAWLGFVQSLRELNQVPDAAVRPAAITTVTTEALVVVLLLVPSPTAGMVGSAIAAGLLAAFVVVIGLAIARGNRTPCRCFGTSNVPLGWPHVVRNLVLIGVAGLGLLSASAAGTTPAATVLLAGAGGLVAGILITAAEDIVALVRPAGPPRPTSVSRRASR